MTRCIGSVGKALTMLMSWSCQVWPSHQMTFIVAVVTIIIDGKSQWMVTGQQATQMVGHPFPFCSMRSLWLEDIIGLQFPAYFQLLLEGPVDALNECEDLGGERSFQLFSSQGNISSIIKNCSCSGAICGLRTHYIEKNWDWWKYGFVLLYLLLIFWGTGSGSFRVEKTVIWLEIEKSTESQFPILQFVCCVVLVGLIWNVEKVTGFRLLVRWR